MPASSDSPNNGGPDVVLETREILEHDSLTKHETPNIVDRTIIGVGKVASLGAIVLVLVIILQVVLRYGFRRCSGLDRGDRR